MMRWDKRYLKAVADAGIIMRLYGRYVYDSNQFPEARNADDTDEVIAAELKEIANRMVDGIEMEEDVPSRHSDGKIPILDMKVLMDEDGQIKNQHNEKPLASKLFLKGQAILQPQREQSKKMN